MNRVIKKTAFSLTYLLATLVAFAQEKGVDVDIDVNKKDSNWYQQPWVWVIGAAVFIIILAAVLKGGGSRREA